MPLEDALKDKTKKIKAWQWLLNPRGCMISTAAVKRNLISNSSLQQLCDIDQTCEHEDAAGEPVPHDERGRRMVGGLSDRLKLCSLNY